MRPILFLHLTFAFLTSIASAQPDLHYSFRLEHPERTFRGRSSNPIRDSLVAYYGFEESTGTRYDGHGNNHLTAYNNPGDTAGIIGRAVRFDNTLSQYLQTSSPSMSVMNGSWSLMFWARPYDTNSLLKILVSKGQGYACGALEYLFYYQNAAFGERICTHITNQGSILFNLGDWSHYAVVFNSSNDTLYTFVNDTLKNRIFINGDIATFNIFTLGGANNGQYSFYGAIDELYFWRGLCLSAAFIDWYFNNRNPRSYLTVISQ